jgi:aspartate/methionine/tyrosine aminotransferase
MDYDRANAASAYVEFARLYSGAKFNLAASGVEGYPLRHLPVAISDLEINGPAFTGNPPLIERLARLKGVEPDCVIHATGTSMANHLAMAALFAPGDEVLIEEPAYEPLVATALFLGASVKRFQRPPEEKYRIDCAEVMRQSSPRTRLIVLSNLHNPSSALAGRETLGQVGEIARDLGAHVLVDEVYLESLFDQREPSAFHLGKEFVTTSSLTKAFGLGGLRCGWILAEPELAQKMRRIHDLFSALQVHVGELLSVVALDHLAAIASRSRRILETNRSALRALSGEFEHIELKIPAQGTTAFPRLLRGDVDELCRLLREKFETSIAPGRFFGCPDRFRIGLGGDTEMTREGLARLASALKEWS